MTLPILSKKIGLLGGTFDPIHVGHINLAFELYEKRSLDEIWFIPSQISPFKMNNQAPCSIEHRVKMIRLAIRSIPYFCVKDIEKHRPAPSYTFDTIKILLNKQTEKLSTDQFFLLMGEDTALGFSNWYLAEEIVKLVPLLVGSRHFISLEEYASSSTVKAAIQRGYTKTRLMDVSSSDIRQRLQARQDCRHLLCRAVEKYIKKNNLYL